MAEIEFGVFRKMPIPGDGQIANGISGAAPNSLAYSSTAFCIASLRFKRRAGKCRTSRLAAQLRYPPDQ